MASKPKGYGVENRETSIRLHFVDGDGKKQARTLTVNGRSLLPTKANLAHAERVAMEIRLRVRMGTFRMSDFFEGEADRHGTVAAALQTWIAGERMADSTRAGYESAVSFWTNAVVGHRRLGEPITLGQMDVADVRYSHIMLALATRPGLTGKTVNNYRSVLARAFRVLVLDRVLTANPVDETPRAKHQAPPPDPFSLAEAQAIISHMAAKYDPRVANYVRFAFFSGLRTSELAGLSWESVDWGRGLVLVHEAIVRGKHKANTKTDRARMVNLNAESRAALQAQKAHTFLAGGHVFIDPLSGKAWADERPFRRSYWAPTLKALGIRYRRPYNTRHTCATMLLMAGARPLWVASQMGHDLKVLLDRYARWIPDGHTEAEVAKMDQFTGSGPAAREGNGK